MAQLFPRTRVARAFMLVPVVAVAACTDAAGPSASSLVSVAFRVAPSTSGLSADVTARLTDLVAELKGTLTIVVIEHDMRFLFQLADFINVIHWGQVIARGSPQELRANPWVQRSALAALE